MSFFAKHLDNRENILIFAVETGQVNPKLRVISVISVLQIHLF